MKKEIPGARSVLERYALSRGLRKSGPRDAVVETFLGTEKHLSAEDLHRLVRQKHPGIGFATVYRTLRILCESGLAEELRTEEGTALFEHKFGHKHHDHLVCLTCGRLIEVRSEELEKLQTVMARRSGFVPVRHTLSIYGYCRTCASGD